MFSFLAIDFETATNYIPCSLGIARVENNEVAEVRNWLIKPICFPYFHFYAQKIHGIHREDVQDSPTFDILWPEISHYFEGQMILAHNAAFDINVLRKTLLHYHLAKPSGRYMCTYNISRKVWPQSPKYSLDFLSNQEGIALNHHHSDSDAEACARLLLKEAEHLGCSTFKELTSATHLKSYRI